MKIWRVRKLERTLFLLRRRKSRKERRMNMNIIESGINFRGLSNRSRTTRIILHHAAAVTCSVQDIQRWHLANGWAGIGYHFFVRKDGNIYRGRPENTVGAHVTGANSDSIGICFERNYDAEASMPQTQINAGKELVAYLKSKYGVSTVKAHRDVGASSCPGRYFPFNEIAGASGNVTMTGGASQSLTSAPAPAAQGSTSIAELQAECNRQGFSAQKVDGIAGPITLAGCPMVKKGASGNITRWIQNKLNSLGYNCGAADGIFGQNTKNAVIAFQRAKGLVIDGIVGPKTWSKLLGLS